MAPLIGGLPGSKLAVPSHTGLQMPGRPSVGPQPTANGPAGRSSEMIIPLTQSIQSPVITRAAQNLANSSAYIQQLTEFNQRQMAAGTDPLHRDAMLMAYEKMLRSEMCRENTISPIRS